MERARIPEEADLGALRITVFGMVLRAGLVADRALTAGHGSTRASSWHELGERTAVLSALRLTPSPLTYKKLRQYGQMHRVRRV